ncbi:DUF2971 domain-containing protein, partial [bacterium]|nr:DUF2971 domain-containing protein [bacterium]
VFHRGFCRSRMWTQYADNHKGLCLVFNRKRLLYHLNNTPESIQVPGETQVGLFSACVKYDNTLPGLKDALSRDYDDMQSQDIYKMVSYFLFLKIEDYRDEHEFRICIYSNYYKDKEIFKIKYLDSLEAVILGCRFPEPYKAVIKEFAQKSRVLVAQLDWYNGLPILSEPNLGITKVKVNESEDATSKSN